MSYELRNKTTLPRIEFIDPITKCKVPNLPEDYRIAFMPYCTCHKNTRKRKVYNNLDILDDDILLNTYGSCPLNMIAAILGR